MKNTDQKDSPRKKLVVEEVADQTSSEGIKSEIPEDASNQTVEQPKEEESILTSPDSDTSITDTNEKNQESDVQEVKEEISDKKEKPKGNSKTLLTFFVVIIVFVSGFLIGGVIGYKKGVSKGAETSATLSPSLSPSPTSSSEVNETADLTKYTVNILNGSGIKGEATKAEKNLTDAGFKVGTAGNAKTYDYKKTVIQAKDSVDQKYLDELNKTLAKTYVLDDKQKLEDTEKEDVIVIIGSEKPLE